MAIKNILFDLDGTLLPMDMEVFVKDYLKKISAVFIRYGYEPKMLIDSIWAGTGAMIKNDGKCSNSDVFWMCMSDIYGSKVIQDKPLFDNFYKEEFQTVKEVCGYNESAVQTVRKLKKLGFRIILATNPVFPAQATESRIRWAGLSPDDFELYTTYENTSYCKPNTMYYTDIVNRLKLIPEECLMVGNDVDEDMIAETIGMKTFLITDCLLNKHNKDISVYDRGSFDDLMKIV